MGAKYSYETVYPEQPKSTCDLGKYQKLFRNEFGYRLRTLVDKGIEFKVKTTTSANGKITKHTVSWKENGKPYKEIYKSVKE